MCTQESKRILGDGHGPFPLGRSERDRLARAAEESTILSIDSDKGCALSSDFIVLFRFGKSWKCGHQHVDRAILSSE